ncbi:MAG: anaerobic glycerol-3-phosphate dehydrogenase subunit A [Desulfobacterales bacterium]|nr:MAG: anaerobic glycerol-3-phosphate dehydrogenase subunit A [Desulfobacterales bacterium]
MRTQVLIIGGGATGTGLARDLALRGVSCILAEQGDINHGASGANHGYLHSGARYVSADPEGARECRQEAAIIRKIAPHCIEDCGGLWVAVEGDDEDYPADFPALCQRCGISAQAVDVKEALAMEPSLSRKVIAAYWVGEASIDPFRLALENISQACRLGTILLRHHQAIGFQRCGRRIQAVQLRNVLSGAEVTVEAQQVVNAAGAWADEVAALAGATIEMLYSKGTLIVTHQRITDRVIMRLRRPSSGDALIPGGTVSIFGTSSVRLDTLEDIRPTIAEVDAMVEEGAAMLPVLETIRYIRAFAGVRPLIKPQSAKDDREVSRGFSLFDHESDGLANFATISGGKLTTFRLMAEKTADLVCHRLGVAEPCKTGTEPLPTSEASQWSTPGLGPKVWLQKKHPADRILCECEMVPQSGIESVVQAIREVGGHPDLRAIGLRTRAGKGPCQGSFCSAALTAFLYDQGIIAGQQGLADLRDFLEERWKGQRPILWGTPLIQGELKEALYSGLLGLELDDATGANTLP